MRRHSHQGALHQGKVAHCVHKDLRILLHITYCIVSGQQQSFLSVKAKIVLINALFPQVNLTDKGLLHNAIFAHSPYYMYILYIPSSIM